MRERLRDSSDEYGGMPQNKRYDFFFYGDKHWLLLEMLMLSKSFIIKLLVNYLSWMFEYFCSFALV